MDAEQIRQLAALHGGSAEGLAELLSSRGAEYSDVEDEHLADTLSSLADEAYEKHTQSEETEELNQAVLFGQCSTLISHNDGLAFQHRLKSLGQYLMARYEQVGDIADMDEAMGIATRTIDLMTPEGDPGRADWLDTIAGHLHDQYTRQGDIQLLQDALDLSSKAVELTAEDDPEWVDRLSNFWSKVQTRYERLGKVDDLESSIRLSRQIVELKRHMGDPDRGGWLINLGNVLECRYERMGEIANLEEAIRAARLAIELVTEDQHHDRAAALHSLGGKLWRRYARCDDMADLEEAIQLAKQVLLLTPDEDDATGLNSLATLLSTRYNQTGDIEDLEEGIRIARRVLELPSDDSEVRGGWLGNLAQQLGIRYERTGGLEDLEEAIQLSREAIEATPRNHPNMVSRLSTLGGHLESRYDRTGAISDLEEASSCLFDAWQCLNAIPLYRVDAANRCMRLLSQLRLAEAIDLGIAVIEFLPTIHTRSLGLSDQESVLALYTGVASNLCGYLLSENRVKEALQYLEQGRAVIISQLLDDRSDTSSLSRDHPAMAEKYWSLVGEISSVSEESEDDTVKGSSMGRRQEAAKELAACLKDVRAISGYERFLLGYTAAEIQEHAADGAIVFVNIAETRNDAIIVCSSAIVSIELAELDQLQEVEDWIAPDWSVKKRSAQRAQNDRCLKYLASIWHGCVKQVIDKILDMQEQKPSRQLPRVWWIGTGMAHSMPFHAAGIHTRGSVENAYSRILSSYTPSVKALAHARKQAAAAAKAQAAEQPTASHSLLIVTMPTSPKAATSKKAPRPLPGVIEERERVLAIVGDSFDATTLDSPSADQVLEAIQTCDIAHFACHGISDIENPTNSGLILQRRDAQLASGFTQDRLTVQRVSELHLRRAQIAYLSACSTAENKTLLLSDEGLHVVSGFQVAGFPHVVGCLWPAGDSECVDVAARFYSSLVQQSRTEGGSLLSGADVALALHEALVPIRDAERDMPLNWAQFVHYGA